MLSARTPNSLMLSPSTQSSMSLPAGPQSSMMSDELSEVKRALGLAEQRVERVNWRTEVMARNAQIMVERDASRQTQESANPDLSAVIASIDELRQSQERSEESLRLFIQQEFQGLRDVWDTWASKMFQETKDSTSILLKHVQMQPKPTATSSDNDIRNLKDGNLSQASRAVDINGTGDALYDASPQSPKMSRLKRSQSMQVKERQWQRYGEAAFHVDQKNMFSSIIEDNLNHKSAVYRIFRHFGFSHLLPEQMPDNQFARATKHSTFVACSTCLIMASAGCLAFEADAAIKATLSYPKGELPTWLPHINLGFTIAFTAELLFRILALQTWFWMAPYEWGWNLFDTLIVISSLVSDIFGGLNVSFLRALRVSRAIRAARIVRVLRFFRELRKMLFAILGCLRSLAWFLVFLTLTLFMFAILFLQGLVQGLEEADMDPLERQRVSEQVSRWYGSLGGGMVSLLIAVTGGVDWLEVRAPLSYAGQLYEAAFVVYIVFVTVGVMNVLTGVFLANADDFIDHNMVIQEEEFKLDSFVKQMLELFRDMDTDRAGKFTWESFNKAMCSEDVQACLAAHELEPTHAHLLFDLLDDNGDGELSTMEFIMGLLRLKGEAKCLDVRIIQREMGLLPQILADEVERVISPMLAVKSQTNV